MSPMLVQYLVGLCCLRWDPEAVEVTVGDMVTDDSVGEVREVDVTVQVQIDGKATFAFKGYEVKRERAPLDVAKVEQLALKLLDMRGLTHRAIVSTSGYTENAKRKAAQHSVDLFELSPWDGPLHEFFPVKLSQGTKPMSLKGKSVLLKWVDGNRNYEINVAAHVSNICAESPLYTASGDPHPVHDRLGTLIDRLLLQSSQDFSRSIPVETSMQLLDTEYDEVTKAANLPAEQKKYKAAVADEGFFMKEEDALSAVLEITITGLVQWYLAEPPIFYAMRNAADGTAFAAALVCNSGTEGALEAMVFAPTSGTIEGRTILLTEKQKNMIRGMTLKS